MKEECPVGTRLARVEAGLSPQDSSETAKLRFSINFERIRNLRDPRRRNLESRDQDLQRGHFTVRKSDSIAIKYIILRNLLLTLT